MNNHKSLNGEILETKYVCISTEIILNRSFRIMFTFSTVDSMIGV